MSDGVAMTTKDLEQATGISRQTIYSHINRGWLDARMIGNRYDITPSEAIQWANWCWMRGSVDMCPPEAAEGFIKHFCMN